MEEIFMGLAMKVRVGHWAEGRIFIVLNNNRDLGIC